MAISVNKLNSEKHPVQVYDYDKIEIKLIKAILNMETDFPTPYVVVFACS